jgi:hypothetical protein
VILFLRYTTNVLLGYCPDGHPATPSHSFRVLVVRDDIVVIREVFVADGAYSALLENLSNGTSSLDNSTKTMNSTSYWTLNGRGFLVA